MNSPKILLLSTFVFLVTLLSLAAISDVGKSSNDLKRITTPFRFNLINWEIEHIFDKWAYRCCNNKVAGIQGSLQDKKHVTDFFALAENIKQVEAEIERMLSIDNKFTEEGIKSLRNQLTNLNHEQASLEPHVEAVFEKAITSVLVELEIIDSIGPMRFPPVDFAFERGAMLLVQSPKNRIHRLNDILLKPNLDLFSINEIENEVEKSNQENSALIVRVGGLATYPSQVSPLLDPLSTLEMITHEWSHHWLFFRPLGRQWWNGGEIRTINETVADLVAREVGVIAFNKLEIDLVQKRAGLVNSATKNTFDFKTFMLDTRLKLETLLDENKIKESEEWLENRRLALSLHGVPIRKLNTAYFAFYGSYATDSRSGEENPIVDQLYRVRLASGSLSGFLDAVSKVTSAEDLKILADQMSI